MMHGIRRCGRWLAGHVRTWRVRRDLYDDQPDRHPALKAVRVGELFPWKGTYWRVSAIRELPVPAVILVPVMETRASRVAYLKRARRVDRIATKDEQTVAASLERRAR